MIKGEASRGGQPRVHTYCVAGLRSLAVQAVQQLQTHLPSQGAGLCALAHVADSALLQQPVVTVMHTWKTTQHSLLPCVPIPGCCAACREAEAQADKKN